MSSFIFSGDDSVRMWNKIHNLSDKKSNRRTKKQLAKKASYAMWLLAVHCQQLEGKVDAQRKLIDDLRQRLVKVEDALCKLSSNPKTSEK